MDRSFSYLLFLSAQKNGFLSKNGSDDKEQAFNGASSLSYEVREFEKQIFCLSTDYDY